MALYKMNKNRESTFTWFVRQAVQDSQTIIQQTENDLVTWLQDLKKGDIT